MNNYLVALAVMLVVLTLVLAVVLYMLFEVGMRLQKVIENRDTFQEMTEEYSYLLDKRIREVANLKEKIWNLENKDITNKDE
jgi:predicted Holliday junction resolvase-like endonuclease